MIKVAGYCRVSTDKDDQVNSFEAQQRYFREYIDREPGWELCEIYADEGITGTSTKKRTQFNRMINDAYEGKFSLIVTKEVSRFSRNILDTISYTRELRSIGVGVFFVTDRINTLEPEAEMLLSFLASLAQEESRRTSTRVVWGQTRQMEKGVVFGQSMLGYDVKNGNIFLNAKGAETVFLIFHKYAVEQMSTSKIAEFLTKEGYCTYRGSGDWRSNTVIKILKNEKYVGDLIQKKTYTPDFLTHEKKRNTGQVPLIYIKNHHEPIISREIWDLTQERLRQNNKHAEGPQGHSNRYIFSGKIKCGECGASFVSRFKKLKDGTKLHRWSCSTAVRGRDSTCGVGKLLRNDDALLMIKTVLKSLKIDADTIIDNVAVFAIDAIQTEDHRINEDPKRIADQIEHIKKKKKIMMDSCFSGEISKEDMRQMKDSYENQIASLYQQLAESKERKQKNKDREALKREITDELSRILRGEKESELLFKMILQSITVYKNRHIELKLNLLPQIFHFAG